MIRQAALSAVAVLALTVTAGAAAAQSRDEVSINVSYAGVDLDSPQGARVVLSRIKSAARSICGPTPDFRSAATHAHRVCMSKVTNRAIDSLGSPTVTALAGGRTQPAPVVVASR